MNGERGRSCKKHRPLINDSTVLDALDEAQTKLFRRLDNEKGWGAWLSRHEILGFLTEEYHEAVDAVHQGTLEDVKQELLDIVVGCLFAIACINKKKLDW